MSIVTRKLKAALSANLAIGSAAVFGLSTVALSFAMDARAPQTSGVVVVDSGLGLRGTIAPQDDAYRTAPTTPEPAAASIIARL